MTKPIDLSADGISKLMGIKEVPILLPDVEPEEETEDQDDECFCADDWVCHLHSRDGSAHRR